MTTAKMYTAMAMMAAEANVAPISSTTKFFDNDVHDRKVPVDSSNKLVDKVPLQTPSVSSHSQLLTDKVDEHKMTAKDSKIHVAGSVIDDHDPTLDGDETNDPLSREFDIPL